jgi:thiol:disulfide interchange protein DsbD
MVHVKKAMGFVLVGMAFYFLRPLIGDTWFTYGLAGSLLVGAAFLFFMSRKGQQARSLRVACASVLLAGGIAFLIPWNRGGVDVAWQHYEASVLTSASTARQPVVIDFYADWCIPCKELDAKTFSNPAVASELKRFQRVKANLSLPDDPKTQALTKQYAIVGVPTIVFLDAAGQEIRDLRLTGYEDHGKFLGRLQRVK